MGPARTSSPPAFPLRIPAPVQDWFSVGIAIGHDRTVRLVLELDGRIDEARLYRAIRLLMDNDPVLGCRYVARPLRAYWQRREDLDSIDLCSTVPSEEPARDPGAAASGEGPMARDLAEFMSAAIEPTRDPLLQCRIIRSSQDIVCIKVSHAVMDGGGFKQLIYRLVAIYRSLRADPAFVPPVEPQMDRGQGQVLRFLPVRTRIRALFTQPFHKKVWGFPYVGNDVSRKCFSSRTLSQSVARLRAELQKRGATITEALFACFARTLFEITDAPFDQPMPFILPIDLRRYLREPRASDFFNLSSLAWITVHRRRGESFEETLAEVHGELSAMKDDCPGVGLAMVMEIMSVTGSAGFVFFAGVRARMARKQNKEFPSLSNIGTVEPASLDFGDVQTRMARFYAPAVFPPTFGVVSGGFQDSMYLTASYCPNTVKGDMVERFLDRMAGEMSSLA